MKNLLVAIFCLSSVLSQAQAYQWTWTFDISRAEECYKLAVDHSGNTIMAGHFSSVPLVAAGTSFEDLTNRNYFLVKVNPEGETIWAMQPITKTEPNVWVGAIYEMETDIEDNIYIAGTFIDSISYGSCLLSSPSGNTTTQGYVAKLNPDGECLWMKSAISNSANWMVDIAVDSDQQVYVNGTLNGSIDVGDLTISENSSGFSSYLLKLDENGKSLWAKTAVSSASNGTSAIDIEGDRLFMSLLYSETTNFGGGQFTTDLGSSGAVMELDLAGNYLWHQSISLKNEDGAGFMDISDLEATKDGNVAFTGYYKDDALLAEEIELPVLNDWTNYVAYASESGGIEWMSQMGYIDNGSYIDPAIDIDPVGNIYFTSTYQDSLVLDFFEFGAIESYDIIAARFGEGGKIDWAESFGSESFDDGLGIVCDHLGNVFIAGDARDPMAIGPNIIDPQGGVDAFISKLFFEESVSNVDELEWTAELSIHPNPCADYLNIDNLDNHALQIEIFSLDGKQVLGAQMLQSEVFKIDHLAKGSYSIKIKDLGTRAVLSQQLIKI